MEVLTTVHANHVSDIVEVGAIFKVCEKLYGSMDLCILGGILR